MHEVDRSGTPSDRELKVFITSAYEGDGPIHAFRAYAEQDRFGVHRTTDDPDEADLILFVEHHRIDQDRDYVQLRSHPLVRRYREKSFMYNEQDRPWCALPGLYCSMPRRFFSRRRQRGCSYVHVINPYVEFADPGESDPDLLFSFIGSPNCEVRTAILELEHPRALIAQTTTAHNAWRPNGPAVDPHLPMRSYARILQRSKFVLCPRGVGTSTFRLFEVMQTGRVPVILSDQRVAPDGPDWHRCAIRVREQDAHRLPQLLEAAEPGWLDMAAAARKEWDTWFAPDVIFHRWTEACADILADRRIPEAVSQRIPQPVFLERQVRRLARPLKGIAQARSR